MTVVVSEGLTCVGDSAVLQSIDAQGSATSSTFSPGTVEASITSSSMSSKVTGAGGSGSGEFLFFFYLFFGVV